MKKKTYTVAGAAFTAAALALSYHENRCLDVCHLRVRSAKLPASFAGFRIVQLSDLHTTRFGYHQKHPLRKIRMSAPTSVSIHHRRFDRSAQNCKEYNAAGCTADKTGGYSGTGVLCAGKS